MSTLYYTATITLECVTPLHIGSGKGTNGSDAGLVLDPNGLPTLPGSSIQGLLRNTCAQLGWNAEEWFGYGAQKKDKRFPHGRQSHLAVSWGLIHDSNSQPVQGLISPHVIQNDPVLRNAANPGLRDHVCLDHRRTAKDRGKFDELALSAGHRFTFELRLKTNADAHDQQNWETLLGILDDPLIRLGGKTRRGFGGFKIVAIDRREFDLSQTADRQAWLEQAQARSQAATGIPNRCSDTSLGLNFSCQLNAESLWMIGGGVDEDADASPLQATRIQWNAEEKGQIVDCYLIPGTSIKGALAHRICFHANRLAQVFIDQIPPETIPTVTGPNNEVVRSLFGDVVDHDESKGKPGRIFIDDVYLPVAQYADHLLPPQNHVAIDPFTGGAKDTALFQDRPLQGGTINVPIFLRGTWAEMESCEIIPGKSACAKAAFEAALANLQQGTLAIGAFASRGYGTFNTHQTV